MKKRKTIAFLLVLLLCMTCSSCKNQQAAEEEQVLLRIGDQETEPKEGQLYLELTRRSFETIGGPEIWNMNLEGHDPAQMMKKKALESMIRVKVMAQKYGEAGELDTLWISRGVMKIRDTVGDDWLEEHGISDEDLFQYIRESYLAYLYEKSLRFVPGSYEETLKREVESEFIGYNFVDKETYLKKVRMQWLMVYTGEWISDQWVQYPQSEQEAQYQKIEEAKALIDRGAQFYQVVSLYSEDETDKKQRRENPLLYNGAVQSAGENTFYRGQIQSDLAEQLFKIPVGEVSDILETQYGYLIVYVEEYPETTRASFISYDQQLRRARQDYRDALLQELVEDQLEVEYQRILDEVDVYLNEKLWNSMTP